MDNVKQVKKAIKGNKEDALEMLLMFCKKLRVR